MLYIDGHPPKMNKQLLLLQLSGIFVLSSNPFIMLPSNERSIEMNHSTTYRAGLYCRLSKEDDIKGESSSISTQKAILTSYCQSQGYENYDFFVDDGFFWVEL